MKFKKSPRKDKKFKVKLESGKIVHFGDPDATVKPGTKKADSYCARSFGLAKKYDILGDKTSPNYWSRKVWKCKGKKSER